MPTGYTAPIADGIGFEQFVWSCARAFGALVMMRDEPAGAPIPDRFEPSDYHAKELAKAHDRLATFEAMSEADAGRHAKAEYVQAVERHGKRLSEIQALSDKYHTMLARVVQWEAPTPDHQGLKDFMAQQLRESIDFDCSTKYITAPVLLPASAWLEAQKGRARKDVDYHTAQYAEEVQRTENRNAWLKALRDSVPMPAQASKEAA